jgi:predicted nucleic acid-binding protein
MEDQKSKQTVFVDSDAFVALLKEDDTNHEHALGILNELLERYDTTFVTSNYVFSEVVTVVSQKVGHSEAVAFIDTITSPEYYIEMKRVSPEVERQAIEVFKGQTSKNVSFVDCTNMALMSAFQIQDIFSFDGGYKTNGYTIREMM